MKFKKFLQHKLHEMKKDGDWDYTYNTFAKLWKSKPKVNGWEFDTDYHAASLLWLKDIKGKLYTVYISPFYDDRKETVIQVEDEDGNVYDYYKKFPFKVTRDEEKDQKAYMALVKKVLTDVEKKLKAGSLEID